MRKAFFSFHYKPDSWRAGKVRNMGVVEGNQPCLDNDWESITSGGDDRIKQWIEGQLSGKSVAIVLIGSHTAGRKWIKHEIQRAWNLKKGLVGVHIYALLDRDNQQSTKGRNPFEDLTLDGRALSQIVKAYDPQRLTSTGTYNYIRDHLEEWIERAIEIRAQYG